MALLVNGAYYVFTLLLLCSGIYNTQQAETLSDANDICRLFQNDVQMRKPGYCTKTIQCVNHQSVDLEDCIGSKPFATTKGNCAKSVSDSYCQAPCTAKSPFYVADKRNCEGWYECNKAAAKKNGYCPDHLHFDQSLQACVEPSATSCIASYEVCDVAPTGTFFKDEQNCGKYYKCESSSRAGISQKSYSCEAGKYYDVDTAMCKPKSQVRCEKYPYPENVCGTTKLAIRNRFVSDGASCRGYFYCKDLGSGVPDATPNWRQCSANTFFREDMQSCMDRNYVSCEEDRCDGIEDGKALSEANGCQHYFVCNNSRTVGEPQKCDNNNYFDPYNQQCTINRVAYPICS